MRMTLRCRVNFQSALRWFFRTAEKNQRHPISGWEPNQFAVCFRATKRGSASHDLIEFLQQLDLLVHEQLRITDNVNQQDIPDLKLEI
jgi:hypothetical protein